MKTPPAPLKEYGIKINHAGLGHLYPPSLQNLLNKKMQVFWSAVFLLVIRSRGMEKTRVLGFYLSSSPCSLPPTHFHLSLAVFPELLFVVFHAKVANHTLIHNVSPANIWPIGTG